MKVFLSWSGTLSHRVACVFREWLPSVIQSVKPYVSSEDIDKGTRWSTDIAGELEAAHYGIICVTRENLVAPWVSFEAGALSKTIDKSNVTPFLFNIRRSEVQGPLLQFQSVIYEKEEVFKLIKSINNRLDEPLKLSDAHLDKTFKVWWPQLDSALGDLMEHVDELQVEASHPKDNTSEILEEMLELVRMQQRILTDPERLLPPEYFGSILERSMYLDRRRRTNNEQLMIYIRDCAIEIESLIGPQDTEDIQLRKIAELAAHIRVSIRNLRRGRLLQPIQAIEFEKKQALSNVQLADWAKLITEYDDEGT